MKLSARSLIVQLIFLNVFSKDIQCSNPSFLNYLTIKKEKEKDEGRWIGCHCHALSTTIFMMQLANKSWYVCFSS